METNINICPEDTLEVVLLAKNIPEGAQVTKVSGHTPYTLKHDLMVYLADVEGVKQTPLMVEGHFLVGPRGGINQVDADCRLVWRVTAEEFIDTLQLSWEGPEQ